MRRSYYTNSISQFLVEENEAIYGRIALNSDFAVEQNQKNAWIVQIDQLKVLLKGLNGTIYFEYSIPRMGKRVDVLLVIGKAIFVVEYKVGEEHYPSYAVDQVVDYALDLKNFHATSHDRYMLPILIATEASDPPVAISLSSNNDRLFKVAKTNGNSLNQIVAEVHAFIEANSTESEIQSDHWEKGNYCPTQQSSRLPWPYITDMVSRRLGGGSQLLWR